MKTKLNFVKEKSKQLSLLIKRHGYWSNEVRVFNDALLNEIGYVKQYIIIQEMAKNKIK